MVVGDAQIVERVALPDLRTFVGPLRAIKRLVGLRPKLHVVGAEIAPRRR